MKQSDLDKINDLIDLYADTGFCVPVSVELLKQLAANTVRLRNLESAIAHPDAPTEFEQLLRATPPKDDTVLAIVRSTMPMGDLVFTGKAEFTVSQRPPFGSTQRERNMRQSGLASTPRTPPTTLLGYPVVLVDEAELLGRVILRDLNQPCVVIYPREHEAPSKI